MTATPRVHQPISAAKAGVFYDIREVGSPWFATHSGTKWMPLQVAGTLGGMKDWRTYYRAVVVPKLKARKVELGRAVPERTIAFDVMMATGQDSSRSLLQMWLRGEREPTVSQFMALCDRLDLNPIQIISQPARANQRQSARRFTEDRKGTLGSKVKQRLIAKS